MKVRYSSLFFQGFSVFLWCLILSAWMMVPASVGPAAGQEKKPGPGPGEITVGSLVSMDARKAVFEIIEGEGKGRKVSVTLESSADKESWVLTFENLYRFFIHRSPEGAVRIGNLELFEKKKRAAFSPPFTLIPAVQDRDRNPQTGRIDIFNMDNGEKAHRGEYTEEFKQLRRADFNTPDGVRTGYLQKNELLVDLIFANVEIDLEVGWSDDRELVYWRPTKTIEKIGLFRETTFRELTVSETP